MTEIIWENFEQLVRLRMRGRQPGAVEKKLERLRQFTDKFTTVGQAWVQCRCGGGVVGFSPDDFLFYIASETLYAANHSCDIEKRFHDIAQNLSLDFEELGTLLKKRGTLLERDPRTLKRHAHMVKAFHRAGILRRDPREAWMSQPRILCYSDDNIRARFNLACARLKAGLKTGRDLRGFYLLTQSLKSVETELCELTQK